MAFIGDKAYCEKYDSTGTIMGGARVSNEHRMIDEENGGRRQAVGGDYVLCKCSERPQVIARYGRNWFIEDEGDVTQRAGRMNVPTPPLIYDEQFTLLGITGKTLSDTYYTVRMPSGRLLHGITDSQGRTGRYETDGAQSIHIYPGHKET
ncbi:hypothetical protein [Paraburkholderia ribeironis]|nr:hypothetical protein [Paraburkholderia ribeironis]